MALHHKVSHQKGHGRLLRMESLEDRRLLAVAEFALFDLNTTSSTFFQEVSPSDFAGRTSGWYFGHAT